VASFILTAEQEALRDGARKLARERLPVAHLRGLRDRRDPDGLSRPLWRELAELGWAGIAVPEAWGGAGSPRSWAARWRRRRSWPPRCWVRARCS
jgi:alkylation response protein AidB-like acyl-CoA dehydrogenase